ncbi:hypothetical protein C8R41DRAFT_815787 [Lentinula lateritia]|uniref:Uncharacterized protein n=1 Tax=Lentinula lateritia TaxID=40482 RepID=A0ABQ8VX01_9AGAR|nr:hypothetical protein C8R41DRAFT_815787 [Lentinula lateritia]
MKPGQILIQLLGPLYSLYWFCSLDSASATHSTSCIIYAAYSHLCLSFSLCIYVFCEPLFRI